MNDLKNLAMLDVAEALLKENNKPMSIDTIIQKVVEIKGIDPEDYDKLTQLYMDITQSAKFVYNGNDEWDLKERNLELWDKDGYAFVTPDEVEEVDEEDDDLEFTEFVLEEKEEDEELEEEEDEEDDDEEIKRKKAEEEQERKEEEAYIDVELSIKSTDDDDVDDDIDLEFDEYDEDDYNDIMDDYEDMYDED